VIGCASVKTLIKNEPHESASCKAVAKFVSPAPDIRPTYLRLPSAGTQDPIFGLSRSTWNNLILQCKANGGNPPIRSISVKQRHALRGVRLVVVESALEYFAKLETEQTHDETDQQESQQADLRNDFSI